MATLCAHCHTAFSWQPTIMIDHNLITGDDIELQFCSVVHARWYATQDRVDMELAIDTACHLMDCLIVATLAGSWEVTGIRNQYLAVLCKVAKYSNYSVGE